MVRISVPGDCSRMKKPRDPFYVAAIIIGLHAPLAFSLSLVMKPVRSRIALPLPPQASVSGGSAGRRVEEVSVLANLQWGRCNHIWSLHCPRSIVHRQQ